MIKVILFDFNGVIINDEPLHLKAYQQVLKSEGIELTEQNYFDSLGMDDRTFVAAAFKRAEKDLSEETYARVLEAKNAVYAGTIAEELPLFPGIEDFVKMMHFHFRLGIVSMAQRAEINSILQRADLAAYFSTIVSAEDVTFCKPDKQCFDLAFKKMDEEAAARDNYPLVREQVLVIEDSPPGIVGAKSAGMKALGVTNTVSADRLRAAGADAVTKNLSDWIPETVELVFR